MSLDVSKIKSFAIRNFMIYESYYDQAYLNQVAIQVN